MFHLDQPGLRLQKPVQKTGGGVAFPARTAAKAGCSDINNSDLQQKEEGTVFSAVFFHDATTPLSTDDDQAQFRYSNTVDEQPVRGELWSKHYAF